MANRVCIYHIVLFFSVLLQGCLCTREAKMLKKMNGKIPASSRWLGGKDGGKWVNISVRSQNIIEIVVYNEFSGTKITELFYEHRCPNINEKLVFEALNYFADGMHWDTINPISKCINIK